MEHTPAVTLEFEPVDRPLSYYKDLLAILFRPIPEAPDEDSERPAADEHERATVRQKADPGVR